MTLTDTAPPTLTIRPAADGDLAAITRIYAHHVLTGTASFELEAPSQAEMRERWEGIRAKQMPYLVATLSEPSHGGNHGQEAATLVGYAYASSYRPRPAYRHTVENSVYVDAAHHGRGVGSALLAALIEQCEAGGWRQMIAVIGGANPASVALHHKHGFHMVGTLENIGHKHGLWLGTALMQRALGPGAASPPDR